MHPRKYVHLSLLISEFIVFSLMITIFTYGLIIHNKKEYVWIASKILTIKQMLTDNLFNNYPLKSIKSDNNNVKLAQNYEYYLKHSSKTICKQNFKKCGILDTYGNIMCIPENDLCPINEIIVDSIEKKNEYTKKGYEYTQLEQLNKNYYLYYTNKEIDKEIVVSLNISDEQPKYISPNNFIFDEGAYDKYLVSHISSGSGDGDYGGSDYDGGGGYDGGGDSGGGIGDGGGYWRNLDLDAFYGNSKSNKYIYEKFEEKKNIDIYFKKIYDKIYVKNYIGFESYEQMDIFLKADLFHIFLQMIPDYASTIISIFCALVLLGLCIFSICRLNYKDVPNDHGDPSCITCSKCAVGILYFIIFGGYYIYFICAYCQKYKSPKYWEIKRINSDNFIKDFINELSRGKNKYFILITIFLLSISFIFFILTWIFQPLHQFYLSRTNSEIKNINEKKNEIYKENNLKYNESSLTVDKNLTKNFEKIKTKLDEKDNTKDFYDDKDKKENNTNDHTSKSDNISK